MPTSIQVQCRFVRNVVIAYINDLVIERIPVSIFAISPAQIDRCL